MAKWYVKELSKLTQISVRSLHHYDAIDLLKPSLRLANGYRLYSESDLLKLQQIISLKFFGFDLASIKALLDKKIDLLDHFSAQAACLEEQGQSLLAASQTLKGIISDCSHNKSIPWETIIESIEVYRMKEQCEKTWVAKALTPEQLKEFANFELNLKTRFTGVEKLALEQKMQTIIKEIGQHLDKDPCSEMAQELGKQYMDLINNYYGRQFAELKHRIWEKGFKQGKSGKDHPLSAKHIAWLDKAIHTYYENRIQEILAKIDKNTLQRWTALVIEICGDSQKIKDELYQDVLKNQAISREAKEWLKTVRD
jgi:DNA-binding transcriptional MerR regulator